MVNRFFAWLFKPSSSTSPMSEEEVLTRLLIREREVIKMSEQVADSCSEFSFNLRLDIENRRRRLADIEARLAEFPDNF